MLIDYKLVCSNTFGNETDFVTKTTVLGIFNFRSFLNLSMLLTSSDKAKELRSVILDIVIDTINKCTGGGTKYMVYTDKIYKSIFKENASEYRKILKLEAKENVRQSMSEVLDIISSYEIGFAEILKINFKSLGRKLLSSEVDKLFS